VRGLKKLKKLEGQQQHGGGGEKEKNGGTKEPRMQSGRGAKVIVSREGWEIQEEKKLFANEDWKRKMKKTHGSLYSRVKTWERIKVVETGKRVESPKLPRKSAQLRAQNE